MVGWKGGMVGRLLQKRVKGVPVLIEQGIMETSSLSLGSDHWLLVSLFAILIYHYGCLALLMHT